jgi:hypothetical protein
MQAFEVHTREKTRLEMHAHEIHAPMSCAYPVRCKPLIYIACEIHAPTRYMPVRYINKKHSRERCMPARDIRLEKLYA